LPLIVTNWPESDPTERMKEMNKKTVRLIRIRPVRRKIH